MRKMKRVSVFLLLLSLAFLTACSGISQNYADKINAAAEEEEYISLDDARDKLGDDRVEILVLNSGVIIGVKDVDNLDELEDKIDEGESIKGIVITVLAGDCTSASYREIKTSDIE